MHAIAPNSQQDPNGMNSPMSQWRNRPIAALLVVCLLYLGPPLIAYALNGRSIAEKVVTISVQPLFIGIASLLAVACLFAKEQRYFLASLIGCIGAGLWILSSDIAGGTWVSRWERQVPASSWDELEPMDYVIVLGGGTGKRPDGAAQLGGSGDRVTTAARLYHRGLAQRLITTGDVLTVPDSQSGAYKNTDRPTNQTRSIWKELGVPSEIVESVGGQNTSSEMRELAIHPEWWQDRKCGLVTSAFHIPRAMKLAQANGISLIPIPCDYFSRSPVLTVESFMPKPETLMDVTNCFKEWMGMTIGR